MAPAARSPATKGKLPVELEMSWSNYLVPVVTSSLLMTACWTIGHFNLSYLWILLFTFLYVIKTHAWIARERKRIVLRNMILRERETVLAQYKTDDLPAWVQFPDIERIEWVNKIIHQLWPYIGEYSKVFLREFIEPQIRSQMPSPFKSFKFTSIDMGDIPCRVGGLKVYTQNVGRDKVIMDMDVVYAGDAEFSIKACGFQGGLNQLVLSGKLRCTLQPLLPYPPMVGGVSGAFVDLPKLDFTLTGMGEFVQLPGLIDAIRSVMNSQIANLAVLPNKIVVQLAPNVDVSRLYFPEPDGVIRLKVIEAMNLENKDRNFLNRKDISDPYCEIQVGSQVFLTKVINNDLNPQFNECFEAVVDQASGQRLRIELFDKDTTGADEELGRLSIPLDTVRQCGEIQRWYHLEGCKHGELHLKVCWLNLSTNPVDRQRDEWESEWLGADKPMHPAILMVYVDSIANLPYPKSNLEPSPFVELTLGRISQRSPVKPKTVNPLYQSKFSFFVKNPEGQELKIRAVDDGTRREIGELSISLNALYREPMMQFKQETFFLQHGVHSSPIVLTVRLRFFSPPSSLLEKNDSSSAYGTAIHIERGEKENEKIPNEESAILQNGMVTNSAEKGKTVTQNSDIVDKLIQPEIKLDAHNQLNIHRAASAASTVSSRAPRSRTGSFLDKLKGKHAKMRKNRDTAFPAGKLQVGLKYDQERFKLVVHVLSAKDLIPAEREGHADPYVQLRLMPIDAGPMASLSRSKKHTQTAQNTLEPVFDEQFEYDVLFTDLFKYKLLLTVKDAINYGVLTKQPILGMVEIPLKHLEERKLADEANQPHEYDLTAAPLAK